ncbi:DLW-39 family protein [Georgenia faecalis]|uniref:DLW-39 family protein n=1 Tax=Georgenia faecalis TaxID=2483799 RepID=A0ABV9D7T2_9MICO
MKKILMLAAVAVAGYSVWTSVQRNREERDLWAEVTDSFGENSFPEADAPTGPVTA